MFIAPIVGGPETDQLPTLVAQLLAHGLKRQVEGGQRTSRTAQKTEKLQGIQGRLGEDLAGEVSLAEKLAAVKRTITEPPSWGSIDWVG